MFEGFANVWTPLALSKELGKGRVLGLRLAGEPVVLFRGPRGEVGALIDRCPHRGVRLSLGRVSEDGCLECPFHGWSFRADGACARVPLNEVSEEKRGRYAATGLPAREVGGLIWVYTGLDPAGTEPAPPPALVEPGWRHGGYVQVWDAHWTRAMENMLDMPHLPFIHRSSIGRQMRSKLRLDSVLRCEVEQRPYGMDIRATLDDGAKQAGVAFFRPNGMELRIAEGKWHGHVYCVPMDQDHTRMIFTFGRKFLKASVFTFIGDLLNRRIAFEDKAVVESSYPREVPPPAEELSVATDAPTLHFRRYYYRELRGSTAALVSASRLARKAGAELLRD